MKICCIFLIVFLHAILALAQEDVHIVYLDNNEYVDYSGKSKAKFTVTVQQLYAIKQVLEHEADNNPRMILYIPFNKSPGIDSSSKTIIDKIRPIQFPGLNKLDFEFDANTLRDRLYRMLDENDRFLSLNLHFVLNPENTEKFFTEYNSFRCLLFQELLHDDLFTDSLRINFYVANKSALLAPNRKTNYYASKKIRKADNRVKLMAKGLKKPINQEVLLNPHYFHTSSSDFLKSNLTFLSGDKRFGKQYANVSVYEF